MKAYTITVEAESVRETISVRAINDREASLMAYAAMSRRHGIPEYQWDVISIKEDR